MLFTLVYNNPPRAVLAFRNSFLTNDDQSTFICEMMSSDLDDHEDDINCDIDFTTFVSIDSKEFQRVVEEFRNIITVYVFVTNLQVRFTCSLKEIILSQVEEQCIIGGIEDGQEIQFVITLHPSRFFNELSSQVGRVWLYRTSNARGAIFAPINSNAQFVVYFPIM
ncbi:uncharacterized protein LOC111806354 [Cucurbita pepo subsp. pepo]|uniref:uncharacterized protein LOC111806354 n=1 Tax=Cucurbita pepo subsp. pepo TaxID=3664 RepID=UPI000C9D31C9|nr:uncharacterized protein LOC111806354 [Cucurbita pepo subsp. pepo]